MAHFAMLSRGNCWLSVQDIPDPIPSPVVIASCWPRELRLFCGTAQEHVQSGASARSEPKPAAMSLTVEVVEHRRPSFCGSLSFDRANLNSITQLLPDFILIQSRSGPHVLFITPCRHWRQRWQNRRRDLKSSRIGLGEVLFIQVLRAHIASEPARNKGWLRATFDPQIGTALSAIHDRVNTHPGRSNRWPKRRVCLARHSRHVSKLYSDKHHWNT